MSNNVDTTLYSKAKDAAFMRRQMERFGLITDAFHKWRHDLVKEMAEYVKAEPLPFGNYEMNELEMEMRHLLRVHDVLFKGDNTDE